METETEKIIKQQLEYLSEKAVAFFADPKTSEKILEIGKISQLNADQLEIFKTETYILLLGLANQNEYQNELKNKLGILEENLNRIIKGVFNFIPSDITKELEEVYKDGEEEPSSDSDSDFSNIPKNVQEAIANSGWKEKLYGIANKHKLTISQMGTLEEVTMKVMRGDVSADKYESELALKIITDKENLTGLVNDVNENILKLIRELMKRDSEEETKKVEVKPSITHNYDTLNTKDEIPVPPYAKKTENPTPKTFKIPDTPIKPIDPPKSIIEEKLKNITASEHSVSDYSKQAENTPLSQKNEKKEPEPKSSDPYREAIG